MLIAILILATILRFYQLNTLPALNADEAAIGYNAYSLISTGKDEHGHPWPIHFESFGDFKPGLFFYLVLPFVWLLGLNEWAVRVPGALLGVGTVFLMYLLVGYFSPKKNFQLLATMLLAISPWHIHFSRGGWEVNAGTFFIVLGLWLFLKGFNNYRWWMWSTLALVASFYTYHSARIVVPLLLLWLLVFYRQQLWSNRKKLLLPVALGIILLIPLVRDFTGPAGNSRASGVSIFADLGVTLRINVERGEHGNNRSFPALIFHNKVVNFGYEFLSNWGEHFWGEFLFISGDEIQRNKVPEFGVLYLVQLPFLIIGFLAIARSSTGWGVILWWLMVAPAAAALTFQSPHALRAHNMLIPLTIITAYGLNKILEWKYTYRWVVVLIFLLLSWDFSRYLHQYYAHMAKEYPFSSQYGVKELVSYINQNYDKYPEFIITDRYDQPYILFLFYMNYPPQKFQGEHNLSVRDKFGFSTVRDFDKFHFQPITKEVLEKSKGNVVVGAASEVGNYANIIHVINFPNGKEAFKIVANQYEQ